MGAALNAEEFGYLVELLRRFAENDLDPHDAWRLETSCGAVYFTLGRTRRGDEPAEAFRQIEPPSPHRTGRAAHVSDLSAVRSREDVQRVTGEMAADLQGGGTAEWENGALERFLEAYGGVLDCFDGDFANQGETMSWIADKAMPAYKAVVSGGFRRVRSRRESAAGRPRMASHRARSGDQRGGT